MCHGSRTVGCCFSTPELERYTPPTGEMDDAGPSTGMVTGNNGAPSVANSNGRMPTSDSGLTTSTMTGPGSGGGENAQPDPSPKDASVPASPTNPDHMQPSMMDGSVPRQECRESETQVCGTDVGRCTIGEITCISGHWSECLGATLPREEACNQEDDDCDSVVDEGTCDCQNGQRRECGSSVGRCQPGIQNCQDGQWSACQGAILPADADVCNTADDDCDGRVDENTDIVCGNTDIGACQLGRRLCLDGALTTCREAVEPTEEGCNNIDDDCDGRIDEDVTRPCGSAEGICQLGQQRCSNGRFVNACIGDVEPEVETCDERIIDGRFQAADEDCDGQVDESCVCASGDTKHCGTDVGECSSGLRLCDQIDQSWGACMGSTGPSAEVCLRDNQSIVFADDEDCDGKIEEGCTCREGEAPPCSTDIGECTTGVMECGPSGRWATCSGVTPRTENACNQVDDDCDGRTDEETVDVCNQIDDDCDGRTDEDHQVSDDVCNGIDDDCDGRIDEASLCEAFGGLQCYDGCVNGCCQPINPPNPLCVIDSDDEKQCPL